MTAQKIRAVIVDDEPLARQVLVEYLREHPEIEVAAECSNGFEAVKVIGETSPDLIFLDIQMPKLDGFEVLQLLDDPPAVVFVTAYDEFALKAFEAHAVDYLLKPFSPERLAEALGKVGRGLGSPSPVSASRLARDARPEGRFTERVLIKDGSRISVVPVDEIDYLEAQDDYVAVHTGGKTLLKQQTLTEFESQLDPEEAYGARPL